MEMTESEDEGESGPAPPIAGKQFPWDYISGGYLWLENFLPFSKVEGGRVEPAKLGAFGLAIAELPNPDVAPQQRRITLPIEHKSDYISLIRAHLDSGVRDKTNELVIVYEPRRGWLGGKRACLHVAAYPAGTWKSFFDAVARYAAKEFRWPTALFLYQPSDTQLFPSRDNLFSP
jgi:hypothetical protein